MTTDLNRRMDSFGNEDFALPELKLIQNVGGDLAKEHGAHPGDFYIPILDEVIKSGDGIDIILVDMQKTRTYWGREDIMDEPPTCASADADTYTSLNGDNCKECPYYNDAPWLLDAKSRREKCLLNYNLLTFRHPDMMPLIIRAGGISTQAARNLLTSFRLNKNLAGQYHKVIVHVGSNKKKTAAGEAFNITFTPKGRIEDEISNDYLSMTKSLLGTQINLLETGEEQKIALPESAEEPAPKSQPVNEEKKEEPKKQKPVAIDTDF